MYEPLAPCPACHRHVRATAGVCPFCQTQIHVARVIPSATQRLARGALFVFASSVAACGGSTAPETPAGDTGAATDSSKTDSMGVDSFMNTDTGGVAPPYGIPPEDTGAVDDTGTPGAKYGAPPPPDAG